MKKFFLGLAIVAGYVVFAFGGYIFGQKAEQVVSSEIVADLETMLADEEVTLSQREIEIYLLAQAIYGEAKGQPDEWDTMASAVVNRVQDDRWPDTLTEVLLQMNSKGTACQIVAMCDRLPEDLSTEIGQAAVAYAQQTLWLIENGTFTVTHFGHSWATPKAAEGHAYFEGLCVTSEGSGHQYFGDCDDAEAQAILLTLRQAPHE